MPSEVEEEEEVVVVGVETRSTRTQEAELLL